MASGSNSPEPRSTWTWPFLTSTMQGMASSLEASMTTRPAEQATLPMGCQPTFHSSSSPLDSLMVPRCQIALRAQEAMRCSPSRTSKECGPSCQAGQVKVAWAGCRARVRSCAAHPSRLVPRRGKPSSPTCRAALSQGMPGWSQVIQARCSPSGEIVGEVTKSVPLTTVRTASSSRAPEPSRGMATRELTGSPGPRWSSRTA